MLVCLLHISKFAVRWRKCLCRCVSEPATVKRRVVVDVAGLYWSACVVFATSCHRVAVTISIWAIERKTRLFSRTYSWHSPSDIPYLYLLAYLIVYSLHTGPNDLCICSRTSDRCTHAFPPSPRTLAGCSHTSMLRTGISGPCAARWVRIFVGCARTSVLCDLALELFGWNGRPRPLRLSTVSCISCCFLPRAVCCLRHNLAWSLAPPRGAPLELGGRRCVVTSFQRARRHRRALSPDRHHRCFCPPCLLDDLQPLTFNPRRRCIRRRSIPWAHTHSARAWYAWPSSSSSPSV